MYLQGPQRMADLLIFWGKKQTCNHIADLLGVSGECNYSWKIQNGVCNIALTVPCKQHLHLSPVKTNFSPFPCFCLNHFEESCQNHTAFQSIFFCYFVSFLCSTSSVCSSECLGIMLHPQKQIISVNTQRDAHVSKSFADVWRHSDIQTLVLCNLAVDPTLSPQTASKLTWQPRASTNGSVPKKISH